MFIKMVRSLFALLILMLFLTSCSPIASPSSTAHEEHDRTTDTWSTSFESIEEKLVFLGDYITIFSEVQDAEYHIIYHDNSGGLIPGPSDWDIRVALKVAQEDIPLWTNGMKKLIPNQIDINLWGELKTERFTWGEPELVEYWKRPDSSAYLVVFPETGILLKIASTMYKPRPAEIAHKDKVSGFDKYKIFVAEKLNYDVSAIPYIITRQVETALLTPGSLSTIIVFEVYIFGGVINTPVIVIDTDENIECEVLIEGSYYTEFSVADVDGDGCLEILVHHETGGNGGAGSHETAVYKFYKSGMKKIFFFPGYDEGGNRSLDTGFMLTLADGWLYTVKNRHTGYSLSFVRKHQYGGGDLGEQGPYFNEHGNITEYAIESNNDEVHTHLGVDPYFYIFDPVDVDDDSVYEIMTAQYTYLWGRADSVGVAYLILKWNTAGETMDVVKAGFWPNEYDFDNMDDYLKRWRDYEGNWYSEAS